MVGKKFLALLNLFITVEVFTTKYLLQMVTQKIVCCNFSFGTARIKRI